jgi:hypothetical protein
VTGGYVYRGLEIPDLLGRYVYSDYCGGWLRSFRVGTNGQATDPLLLVEERAGAVTSLGEDARGEIYATLLDGRVLRLTLKK